MKTLIVIDMQNDFIDGSLGTPEAQIIVPKVKNKIDEYIKNNDKVIFTRDTHFEEYLNTQEGKNLPIKHCIKGTNGWNITSKFDSIEDKCTVIDKLTFGSSELPAFIDKTDEIEMVGLCTDICVISNAMILKAFFPEIKISVVSSCCAGVTPKTHENALVAMKMCQINII
ncbi:MAG: isochorismatase family cysteine hydrolase [Oscillospiraceae bacterium]